MSPPPDIRNSSQYTRQLLDELLEPVADLIPDPLDCDGEVRQVVDRLTYLVTRGPAKDGRTQMLASIAQAAVMLLNEELRGETDPRRSMIDAGLVIPASNRMELDTAPSTGAIRESGLDVDAFIEEMKGDY
jgi:hypothetical protein